MKSICYEMYRLVKAGYIQLEVDLQNEEQLEKHCVTQLGAV